MPGTDLTLLIDAAQAAGTLALRHARHKPIVTYKPHNAGPVTDADLAVDALLRSRLCGARPGYGWLSEETPDTDARLAVAECFIVDPIDGTRGFIEGSPDWAHSLAIVRNGTVDSAVVYLPARKMLFAAERGAGATLNGTPIRVSARLTAEGAKILTTRASLDAAHWRSGIAPGFERVFRSSLAWRLSLVAQGAFDGMLTLRPSWEWDIAAGALILAEAGGTVTDRHGTALRFNRPHPQSDGVVAAGRALHADLIGALFSAVPDA